ncbi:hypothetical protein VIGAN_04226000 [Vigna angularis var. angularis]|uniref:Uncharacterized protein n=1 Tax=Vigna angularis var. angularis TaxID=157739 RepID=A0A0S3RW20_PHAAN|nr:hypothetical protein VIGAN_04226000 [Vigna angularis var. angularis]
MIHADVLLWDVPKQQGPSIFLTSFNQLIITCFCLFSFYHFFTFTTSWTSNKGPPLLKHHFFQMKPAMLGRCLLLYPFSSPLPPCTNFFFVAVCCSRECLFILDVFV